MMAKIIRGRSATIDSKETKRGAIMEATRANVVTPLTPTFRPKVGNNSPETK